MYGISVFLGEEITNDTIIYIKKMKALGFDGIRSLSIESQKKFLTFFQFIKMLAYNFLAIFLHDKIEVPNSIFKNWSNSLFNIQFLFSSTRLIIFKCCFKA
ncbi:hypothetical protein [Enterococcus faecalis]|uniref:hypothetical protein n=1 Tax=Enterococcus faecalis TaxID=1351 RepID=UPI00287FCFA9|nr:hypothetical protein [Enterococcus faecalis]